MKKIKNTKGFTLVELIIVVVIIFVLAAIMLPYAIDEGTENTIVSKMSEGSGPLTRQEWIYYKEHQQELDDMIEKEKKIIAERDKGDKDYQEYLESFKK